MIRFNRTGNMFLTNKVCSEEHESVGWTWNIAKWPALARRSPTTSRTGGWSLWRGKQRWRRRRRSSIISIFGFHVGNRSNIRGKHYGFLGGQRKTSAINSWPCGSQTCQVIRGMLTVSYMKRAYHRSWRTSACDDLQYGCRRACWSEGAKMGCRWWRVLYCI